MGRLAGLLKKSMVQNVQNVVSECYLDSGEAVLAPGKRGAAPNIIPRLFQSSICANIPVAPIFLWPKAIRAVL
jgi:hypothetical protein